MASIYGSVPSLSKQDVREMSEALVKGVFSKPSFNQMYGVRTGIKGQTRLAILSPYSGLSGQVKADCAITAAPGTIGASEKTWTPKFISDRFELCYEDLMGTWMQWILANGMSKEDMSNSAALASFTTEMIQDAMAEAIHRLIVFGETGMVSGTGNSVASGDVKYFTPFNGWWKQGIDIVAADATKRITVAKNAEIAYADQKFDATDTTNQVVTGYLEDAYTSADFRLRSLPKSDLVYICTASLVDQYKRERKKASGIDLAYTRVENGFDTVQCGGIDVVEYNFMDRMIAAYYDDGDAFINPHRGILTTRANAANILIGTEQENNLAELEVNYDKYNKKWFADYGFMLDCKVAIDERVMMIY